MSLQQRRLTSPRLMMAIAVAAVSTLALLVVATTPHLLGGRLAHAYAGLGAARPLWLWLAAAAFLGSLVGTAAAWRTTLEACGTQISVVDAGTRYGIGSLVNTVTPYRLGDAVRVGLFARALEGPQRAWTAGGAFGAIEAARVLCIACVVAVGAAMGALPLWPVVGGGGLVGLAVFVAVLARERTPYRRIGHLLDAFRGLARSGACARRLIGWVVIATLARILAAAAVCAALGLRAPLVAAVLITAALDLTGQIPLTPGNVGITSGAVALALTSRGIGLDRALSAGLAYHGIETIVGLSFGLASAVGLAQLKYARVTRWLVPATAVLGAVVLITGFSLTVLVDSH